MKRFIQLFLLALPLSAAEPFPLWSGSAIPSDSGRIPKPGGLVTRTIHDAREADYKFLHGAAIIHFKGTFYANWANSPINENHPNETLQGKHTKDPLEKWSQLEVIAPGFAGDDRHSHAAYLGKLSTGQLYLVANLRNRNSLVVAVGKAGEKTLSKMFLIRHGSSKPVLRFKGHAKSPRWSYPYAHEHDGKLYLVYSIGKEDCGLSVIPVESLANR